MPKLNVQPTCRAQSDGNEKSLESCLADEQRAHDQLARQWDQFARRDKAGCTQMASGYSGGQSYIEFLTCLEMARDASKLPKDITQGQPGAAIEGSR